MKEREKEKEIPPKRIWIFILLYKLAPCKLKQKKIIITSL